jgi:hypothetical protein
MPLIMSMMPRMDLPIDADYYRTIAHLDAVVLDSQAHVARQRERLERLKSTAGPVDDAQLTLNLMLEILKTIRDMRNRYVSIFRGRLH